MQEQQKTGNEGSSEDLLEGDLDANLGMNDDDLGDLGDFGENFNILEFADAFDGNDSTKPNILDDLDEDNDDANKKNDSAASGEVKPPPYLSGANQSQDPSRGPPPPYPGAGGHVPQKVS